MTKAKAKDDPAPDAPCAIVEAKLLRAALKDVAGAVEIRNTIPILSNVLITVTPDALSIMGTDLDLAIARHCDVVSGARFTTTVEAAVIGRIVDKLPADAQVMLSSEPGRLVLTAGRARFVLPTLPPTDFPAMPDAEWNARFEIDALLLGGALARVAHAVSTEETRFYLNGVFVHHHEGALRFVATDGHRLARMDREAPEGAGEVPDVILPRKAGRVLGGLIDRYSGLVEVSVCATRLRFAIGETVLTSKAIDGIFPDYTRVIPSANGLVATFDKAALAETVDRVSCVSSDRARAVKMVLHGDMAVFEVTSQETGVAREELPCAYDGAALTIGLNAVYLLELLRQISGESVIAAFADAAAPTLWRESGDGPGLFVLMPLRV